MRSGHPVDQPEPAAVCVRCGAAMTAVQCRRSRERFVCRVGAPVPPAPSAAWLLCGSCGHAEPVEAGAAQQRVGAPLLGGW